MVHRCNFAFKTLSTLGIINNIKDLLQSCHAYFAHNAKRHFEFTELTDVMETKGLKMFKYMKTYWISLLYRFSKKNSCRIQVTFGQDGYEQFKQPSCQGTLLQPFSQCLLT
jgi:hypothetical protein